MSAGLASGLRVDYFDGVSARAIPVTLSIDDDQLLLSGDAWVRRLAMDEVQWPERSRHGRRVAHFKQGGMVQGHDAKAWDAWVRANGRREPLIVIVQQSWRWVMLSVALTLVLVTSALTWGLPALSHLIVDRMPATLDAALGESTLKAIDSQLMLPSRLSVAEQQRLEQAVRRVFEASPPSSLAPWKLVFRQSRIGPNALALPGGTMVMTDELVALVDGDEDVLSAVLAHEMGHLQHRHGMQMVVQTSALGILSSVILGDFSSLLAGGAVWLGQANYSRQAEQEADVAAVTILKAAHLSPRLMVTLFERLSTQREEPAAKGASSTPADSWLGIAFASHPSDQDRVRFFESAAQ